MLESSMSRALRLARSYRQFGPRHVPPTSRGTDRRYRSNSAADDQPKHRQLNLAILATITAAALLTTAWSRTHPIAAEPSQNAHSQSTTEAKYGNAAEIRKVVSLLQKQLGTDKVTVNDDERLSHGVSPNTYHSESLFSNSSS